MTASVYRLTTANAAVRRMSFGKNHPQCERGDSFRIHEMWLQACGNVQRGSDLQKGMRSCARFRLAARLASAL
jgi:hypothetical protein